MLTIRAMSNGQGYSARHLEHSDYYAEGERVIGQWHGRGAEMLGLSGEVVSEQFEAVRQGIDPNTGEFLRQRQSADRICEPMAPPKATDAISTTSPSPRPNPFPSWLSLGGDDRLIEAHQKAVDEALKELEAYADTRVRQDGANEDRTHRQPRPCRVPPRHQPRTRSPTPHPCGRRQYDL